MASNQVNSVDASVVAQQTRSTTNTATLAYNQLVSTLAQVQADPTSVSQNELQLLASTVGNAATSLQQTMSSLASQMQASGGTSSTLAAAYMQAKDMLQDLTSNVGRINNALYTGGSSLRLSGSPTSGYSATTVNTNDGSSVTGTSTGSLASQGIGVNDGGSGGISTDTGAVAALQGTPLGNILTAVVQELVSMVKTGALDPQTGSTNTAATSSGSGGDTTTQDATSGGGGDTTTTTSSSTGFNQSAYEAQIARESGNGAANNPLLQSFMNVLDGFLKQQANKEGGGSTNSKSKNPKGTTASAGGGGTTTQDATAGGTSATGSNLTLGSVTGTGTGGASAGGTGTTTSATGGASTGGAGTTTSGTGNTGTTTSATQGASAGGDGSSINYFADGASVDTSGVMGNPYLSAANINGFLLAVLLESYNSGQHDLLTEAQQLQALNRAKDGVRSQLASARSSNSTAQDPGGGNSAQVQDLEDQLQSMGDDAQLEQLNLQNLSQNQQQLLTMISNFMKNTNDDSMSIIRHIGGG